MTNLQSKFSKGDMKEYTKRLNGIFYNATHYQVRYSAPEREKELIDTIDHLCRVSNILCSILEQELDGHIETSDPRGYASSKLSIAEGSLKNYLRLRDIPVGTEGRIED